MRHAAMHEHISYQLNRLKILRSRVMHCEPLIDKPLTQRTAKRDGAEVNLYIDD